MIEIKITKPTAPQAIEAASLARHAGATDVRVDRTPSGPWTITYTIDEYRCSYCGQDCGGACDRPIDWGIYG
jgi:hypothetical protein